MMKAMDKKSWIVRGITGVVLLCACLYAYDWYKCLAGFIANEFHEPLVMLPMLFAFLLPVICFFVFFYDCYVRAIRPAVKAALSVLIALYALADLVLILRNIGLYASNHALGVYDALPGVVLHFPYDMLVLLTGIFAWQIILLAAGNRKGTRLGACLNELKLRGTLRIRAWEYALLCVVALFALMFTGSAACAAFTSFANAFYDGRYVFLLLWFLLIPLANVTVLVLRPGKMPLSKCKKLTVLCALVAANLLFGLLFWLLELTHPDFLVHVGKPMLPITFLASLPIEPWIVFAIMALGTLVSAVRLLLVCANRYQGE